MIQLRLTFALGALAGSLAIAQETMLPPPPPPGEAGTAEAAISISGTAGGDFVFLRTGMGMRSW